MSVDLAQVQLARERISGPIRATPSITSSLLSRAAGTALALKCENLQKTGSFKSRGALNALASLSNAQRHGGVVTVSAGNHAQALAWAASQSGISAVVVMPENAARSKVQASQGYGATVLFEPTSAMAFERARKIAIDEGRTFVHPFDAAPIIAGAGTVGLEIAEEFPDVASVVVPIGGGGLIAGVAIALKALLPDVRVYGVEPRHAAVMRLSLDAGKACRLDTPPKTVADGLAAPMAGELTYAVVRDYVDDVVVVDDDAILDAMRLIVTRTKLLVEPAGAAGVAALLQGLIRQPAGSRTVAVLSGGNVDLERLA